RMNDATPIFPRVFTIIGSLAVAVHGRAEQLDLAGKVPKNRHDPAHPTAVLLHVQEQVQDDGWQWSGHVTVACLERSRRRPALAEVRFAQLLARHLKKQELVAFRGDGLWVVLIILPSLQIGVCLAGITSGPIGWVAHGPSSTAGLGMRSPILQPFGSVSSSDWIS